MRTCSIYALAALVIAAYLPAGAPAQCSPVWSNPFPAQGVDGIIHALAVFDDDATGPHASALYAAGSFLNAGGVSAGRIAKWDGSAWSAVGPGMGSTVFALCVFDDDDTGPHLPALYAAGNFETIGAFQYAHIAKWNGSAWTALGTGVSSQAYALAVYDDDGSGPHLPALYVGGLFTGAGGNTVANIAKWDGTAWSAVGNGLDSYVSALAVYDADGSGPGLAKLIAGGGFLHSGAISTSHVAQWDGTAWTALVYNTNNGVNDIVNTLAVYDDDGSGPDLPVLYVGGLFTTASGVAASRVAKWNGSAWSAVGTGTNAAVSALASFDSDGSGSGTPKLIVGGSFTTAGGSPASYIAQWSGSAWSALGTGVNNSVYALCNFDPDPQTSNQPALYPAGDFSSAGGAAAGRIARWACPTGGTPPSIDVQPQSQSACPGGSVTFNVTASGSPTLTYQWRKGGQNIQNATQSSYTINPVSGADAGSYDVVVTNNYGTATSDPATLTVLDCTPPSIDVQPQSQTICTGSSVTFTVSASGASPLSYQWRKGGVDIQDATQSSYTIYPLALTDTDTYDVVVTNDYGTITSDPATLTVQSCRGDMNCDGLVNSQDIDGFIFALFDLADLYDAYLHSFTEYIPCSMSNADFDGDGLVNSQDIDGFIICLFGGGC